MSKFAILSYYIGVQWSEEYLEPNEVDPSDDLRGRLGSMGSPPK